MNLTGKMLLEVGYVVDEDSRVVTISHPSLSGAMGFEFTTLDLAEVQLQAIRVDKAKSALEEFTDDTAELISLSKKLKSAMDTLKGGRDGRTNRLLQEAGPPF